MLYKCGEEVKENDDGEENENVSSSKPGASGETGCMELVRGEVLKNFSRG